MARKRKEKEKITDPFERVRLKKLRAAQRREERKKRRAEGGGDEPRSRQEQSDYSKPMVKDDYEWIRRGLLISYANKVLNGMSARPYWLSFPYANSTDDGQPPISHFYPCSSFRTKKRFYYGFLFREHRDLFFASLENARKETTDTVHALNPQLF